MAKRKAVSKQPRQRAPKYVFEVQVYSDSKRDAPLFEVLADDDVAARKAVTNAFALLQPGVKIEYCTIVNLDDNDHDDD